MQVDPDTSLQNFIKSNYANADFVRYQVQSVRSAAPDLKPSIATYYFNDGSSAELVSLSGTIPVLYSAATYNIPIEIFLPLRFPDNEPIVHVRPTVDMELNPLCAILNAEGTIDLEGGYSYNRMDLKSLILFLQKEFGIDVPVYKKRIQPVREAANAASQQKAAANVASQEEAAATTPETNLCKVCYDKQKNAILQPCNHFVVCIICANKLKSAMQPCPICRKPINVILRIYAA